MPVVHEIIETSLPPQDTFAFIADFTNSEVWDPGTVSSKPINGTSVGAGSSYDLVVKVGSNSAPMVYTIETYEPRLSNVVVRHVPSETATLVIRFEMTAHLRGSDADAPLRFSTSIDASRRVKVE